MRRLVRSMCGTALLAFVLGMVSCATVPEISPMERRAIQTRMFDGVDYETVFRAVKTVLQDDGYIIKNQDMRGGLIVAAVEKTDSTSAFFAQLNGIRNYRTGEGFELSVNLEALNPKAIEARTTIQRLEQYSLGGQQGEEVLDPALYRNFYNKVAVEVQRRKAMGKS